MKIQRTAAMPEKGLVPAFDNGWRAHEIGVGRTTVNLMAHPTRRSWALLGWDCRELLSRARLEEEQACLSSG